MGESDTVRWRLRVVSSPKPVDYLFHGAHLWGLEAALATPSLGQLPPPALTALLWLQRLSQFVGPECSL